MIRRIVLLLAPMVICAHAAFAADNAVIRVGIIGCDTSHVPAFTRILNDPANTGDLAGVRVVAAFPGGSADLPSSRDRVQEYTDGLRKSGVEIVGSIAELLEKVDCVLLESVDGRPHLEQVTPVFKARKRVFIDKPLAGSLVDAVMIVELGRKLGTEWFSSSSLRFGPAMEGIRDNAKIGEIVGAATWSPCHLEEHHPDLFWYGVHGVESLFTIMGPGCKSVARTQTKDTELAVGVWKDGRVGTFRGIRGGKSDYGGVVFGSKGIVAVGGYEGYKPLVVEIARFFKTGKAPIRPEVTLEIFAFMEAADESKRQDGAPVLVEMVLAKARAEAKLRLGE